MSFIITRFSNFFWLSLSILISVCLLLSNSAFAQTNTTQGEADIMVETRTGSQGTTSAQQKARANIQADRAALKEDLTASTAKKREEVQKKITQRKAALAEKAQERVTNLAANMSNRMEAVIARLQNIADRMESRMDKLKEAGVETSDSQVALASARVSLEAASAEINDIDVAVYQAVSSEDIRTGWQTLKEKFRTIRDLIRTAHSELHSSLTLLKDATLEARAQTNAEVAN